jgi:hypothetical protein
MNWRVSSSGMWRRVVFWDATDVSEEHIASIFRAEKKFGQEPAEIFSSAMKMEAICSSETSVAFQQTTRRHTPEDDTLHNHCCENLKSYMINLGATVAWCPEFVHSCLRPFYL